MIEIAAEIGHRIREYPKRFRLVDRCDRDAAAESARAPYRSVTSGRTDEGQHGPWLSIAYRCWAPPCAGTSDPATIARPAGPRAGRRAGHPRGRPGAARRLPRRTARPARRRHARAWSKRARPSWPPPPGRPAHGAPSRPPERRRLRLKKPLIAAGRRARPPSSCCSAAPCCSARTRCPATRCTALKRASENTEYSLTGGAVDKGKLKLEFAARRIGEVADLLPERGALAAGRGVMADSGTINAADGQLVREHPQLGRRRRHAVPRRLLGGAAVRSKSAGPLNAITSWAPAQLDSDERHRRPASRPARLHDARRSTLDLLDRPQQRAAALKRDLGCSCLAHAAPTARPAPVHDRLLAEHAGRPTAPAPTAPADARRRDRAGSPGTTTTTGAGRRRGRPTTAPAAGHRRSSPPRRIRRSRARRTACVRAAELTGCPARCRPASPPRDADPAGRRRLMRRARHARPDRHRHRRLLASRCARLRVQLVKFR